MKKLGALLIAVGLLCGVMAPRMATAAQGDAAADTREQRYYEGPKTWEQRFTFKGQSRPGPYSKDPNVWVYTEGFATRFGMPKQWVYPNLKGIEAAAWRRVPKGNESCGWAGQEHACKQEYECYLDVYIDERKHPLPWATDRLIDWDQDFTSLQWLSSQNGERHRPLSAFIGQHERYSGVTRPPFADPESKREVLYFATANPKSDGASHRIFGFERSAYPGLTMLVLMPLQCEFGAAAPPYENFYWLDARSEDSIAARILRRFHEFVLPAEFDRRVKEVLQEQMRPEREFRKQILNLK